MGAEGLRFNAADSFIMFQSLTCVCSLLCFRPEPPWRTLAASAAHPAGRRWYWTATASTVCRGTCWWRTSSMSTNRKSATTAGEVSQEDVYIMYFSSSLTFQFFAAFSHSSYSVQCIHVNICCSVSDTGKHFVVSAAVHLLLHRHLHLPVIWHAPFMLGKKWTSTASPAAFSPVLCVKFSEVIRPARWRHWRSSTSSRRFVHLQPEDGADKKPHMYTSVCQDELTDHLTSLMELNHKIQSIITQLEDTCASIQVCTLLSVL